jgi:uncharacterized membrane protein YsdA (DUF1294 family)
VLLHVCAGLGGWMGTLLSQSVKWSRLGTKHLDFSLSYSPPQGSASLYASACSLG